MPVDAQPSDITSLIDDQSLRPFVQRQRWFGGKARPIASTRIVDWAELGDAAWLCIVEVTFDDGRRDEYVVPFAIAANGGASTIEREFPSSVAARLEGGRIVHDALFDDQACAALLALVERGNEITTRKGRLRATRIEAIDTGGGALDGTIQRTAPDQSNTSVIFGRRLIMKIFRHVEDGPNPDVEVSTFLTRGGFVHVPTTVGAVDYERNGRAPASVLMVQRFVENRGNGWQVTLDQLDRLFTAAPDQSEAPQLADKSPPDFPLAGILGRRTGEMHVHLAAGHDQKFAAEAYTRSDLEESAERMRADGAAQLGLLERSLNRLEGAARADADAVLAGRAAVLASFDALQELGDGGQRIRCHGDYHLGQTLVIGDDVMILDFEGEPARSLDERRAKGSPLRDVAGMLRSFSYAAATAVRRRAGADGDTRAFSDLADTWQRSAAETFRHAYWEAVRNARLLASDRKDVDRLLQAFVVDKALYEVGYELNNRPDWAAIPLSYLVHAIPGVRS